MRLFSKIVKHDIQISLLASATLLCYTLLCATTAFYSAIGICLTQLSNTGHTSSDWIIALTDGDDNSSGKHCTAETVKAKLRTSNVGVVVIGIGNDVQRQVRLLICIEKYIESKERVIFELCLLCGPYEYHQHVSFGYHFQAHLFKYLPPFDFYMQMVIII